MDLKAIVRDVIKNEFDLLNEKKGTKYRILVVDYLGTKVISSCFRVQDLHEIKINDISSLYPVRKTLIDWEAVYLITSNKNSIDTVIKQLSGKDLIYNAAHIYSINTCPEKLVNKILTKKTRNKVKTFKEIYTGFIPYESRVFTLNEPDMLQWFFNINYKDNFNSYLQQIGEQIASVFYTLEDNPLIRYRSAFDGNMQLARIIEEQLKAYKDKNPKKAFEKTDSQLIIIDRGFDYISPIVHELTYQAMVYDNLPIENDVYKFVASKGVSYKEVSLNNSGKIWEMNKHEHIALASENICKLYQKYRDEQLTMKKNSCSDTKKDVRQMLNYPEPSIEEITHFNLVRDCINYYTENNLENICAVEQDLIMGETSSGQKIKTMLQDVTAILLNPHLINTNKVRLIIMYITFLSGISESALNSLIVNLKFPIYVKRIITNLILLGVNIWKKSTDDRPRRKNRITESTFETSRWTPIIKDIMEDCDDDMLNINEFPFIDETDLTDDKECTSSQFQENTNQQSNENKRKIYVFIIGGMTFSEIRSAYEVTKNAKNCEIIIGSSSIITPDEFLKSLAALTEKPPTDGGPIMDLKAIVRDVIKNEFDLLNEKKGTKYRILVVDYLGTKVISSCFRVQDLHEIKINDISSLYPVRKTLIDWEAVYLITSNKNSIDTVIKQLSGKDLIYNAAHIYSINSKMFRYYMYICYLLMCNLYA